MSQINLHHADMLEWLAAYDGPLFDSCCTDPPYHLTSIVKRFGQTSMEGDGTNERRAKAGADGMARFSRGFMGKQWDGGDIAQRPETWRAVYDCLKPGAHLIAFAHVRTYHRMACAIEDAGFEIRDQLAWAYGSGMPKSHNHKGDWQGWGTGLKPAWEPICLARKPLIGTVAANLAEHGTGALNIDGCRIDAIGRPAREVAPMRDDVQYDGRVLKGRADGSLQSSRAIGTTDVGRWPANIIHDGSEEVEAAFPDSNGQQGIVTGNEPSSPFANVYGDMPNRAGEAVPRGDSGSAARFFYSAKAGPLDRMGTAHATVKPVDLMRWLTRLVTPPGGHVLDPFAGSGTTGIACMAEGFDCTLIELEADHHADIERKLSVLRGEGRMKFIEHDRRRDERAKESADNPLPLFGGAAA